MAEVLIKEDKYINGEEALISKKGSSSTHKGKRRGLTSDSDGAQKEKEIGRGPQRKTVNGPRKDVEASEIAWVHLSLIGDNSIHLGGLPP